ncbi:MAG: diadenylate cyclase CdaA [Polyangiaceae bacterium]
MLEGLLHLFSARPWQQVLIDLLDLAIVTVLVYRGLLVLRGTRAMQMGTGLAVIFLIYVASKWANLVTLHNLLSSLLSSVILIVVVVFQNDIRRGLMRVGSRAFLGAASRQQESRVVDEVVAAAQELARHRMGALICFEQEANLDEFVVGQGTIIDAAVQRELLVGLFVPESVNKLHDGAVIIRHLRMAKAGVFFQMHDTKLLDKSLGSRHRAALGITEETDAVVVVVSEERGTISFCFNGNIISNLDGASLRQALLGLFGQHRATKKKTGSPVSKKDPSRKDRQTGSYRISVPPSGGSENTGRVSVLPQAPSPALSSMPPAAEDSEPSSESDLSVVGPRPEPPAPIPMAQAPKINTPMPSEPEE